MSKIYMETIPIVHSDQSGIENIVDKILSLRSSNPKADTLDLEAEIDRLVYGLYGLGEREILVVEGKSL